MAQQDDVLDPDEPPEDDPHPGADPADAEVAGTAPEERLGGDRRHVFTGGIWSAASTVLPMGSTLALSIVISRFLGPEVLGEQSLVAYVASLMVSVLIYSFTVASIPLLATASGARDEARLAWLARWSTRAHLLGGAFASTTLVMIGLQRDQLQSVWFIAAATAFVDAVCWSQASRHVARHGWSATASRRLVAQAATPTLGIAAVLLGAGIEGVFVAQLLASSVLVLFLRRLERSDPMPSTKGLEPPEWRPVLRLWSLFALSSLINNIVDSRIELTFLDVYRSSTEVAMFSVASNVVGIALVVCSSLISAAVPAIAAAHGAGQHDRVRSSLSRAMRVVVATSLLLVAGALTVAPGVVIAFWGQEFVEAAGLVRWLGLTLLLAPAGALCNAYWLGTGRLRPVLAAGGVGAVLDLGLAWALVPSLGTEGAVVASVVGRASSAALILVHTFRSGLRLRLYPGRTGVVVLIAAASAGAALLTDHLVPGGWSLPAAVLAFCLTTALGMRLLGLLGREDLEWFEQTLPGPASRLLRALSPARR